MIEGNEALIKAYEIAKEENKKNIRTADTIKKQFEDKKITYEELIQWGTKEITGQITEN